MGDSFTIHRDHTTSFQNECVRHRHKEREFRELDEEEEEECEYSEEEEEEEEEEREDVDVSVQEDMWKLEETFRGFTKKYRLINRIGEGTFSTVYKAEDLQYDSYDNSWDFSTDEENKWSAPPSKKQRSLKSTSPNTSTQSNRKQKLVAIKKIYATSSPLRIQNELELLHDLQGYKSVCPLITAIRHHDQVIAILPYFVHRDFRTYYQELPINQIRYYFRSLFDALAAVHDHHIIHRDIKPTNFLYDVDRRTGVLVDFGLAEREGTDWAHCTCTDSAHRRREKIENSVAASQLLSQQSKPVGYPKNDPRPSRRANRAGTRGFRAPEVLFKCTSQTTKIDIWSAGVILLTILAKRFPFFNSTDDIDAMIELSHIFGAHKMKQCALLHGTVYETTIPTIGKFGHDLKKIVLWSTNRVKSTHGEEPTLEPGEAEAIEFLCKLLELDPNKRLSAKEALEHEFLKESNETRVEDEEDGLDDVDIL